MTEVNAEQSVVTRRSDSRHTLTARLGNPVSELKLVTTKQHYCLLRIAKLEGLMWFYTPHDLVMKLYQGITAYDRLPTHVGLLLRKLIKSAELLCC